MSVPFEYAVVRVVPRIDRGESINAGVLVHCRDADYLGAAMHLDVERLAALDPSADVAAVSAALQSITAACATGDDTGAVFRWLTAPRSTVVQPGPVHTGITVAPRGEAQRLLGLLVLPLPG